MSCCTLCIALDLETITIEPFFLLLVSLKGMCLCNTCSSLLCCNTAALTGIFDDEAVSLLLRRGGEAVI